jgi:hypothetical protein
MTHPWEQRDDESSKAFAAFVAYLELGPERSIDKAAQQSGIKTSSTRARWWLEWSRRFDWVARARAFDAHEFAERIAARDQVREEVRQMFIDGAKRAAKRILDLIDFDDPERPSAGAKVSLEAAAKALVAAGVDAPKKVEVSGPDGRPMELDVRRMLADAIDKIGLDPELAMELAEKLQRVEEEA